MLYFFITSETAQVAWTMLLKLACYKFPRHSILKHSSVTSCNRPCFKGQCVTWSSFFSHETSAMKSCNNVSELTFPIFKQKTLCLIPVTECCYTTSYLVMFVPHPSFFLLFEEKTFKPIQPQFLCFVFKYSTSNVAVHFFRDYVQYV